MEPDQEGISGDPPSEITGLKEQPQPDSGEVSGASSQDPTRMHSGSYTMGDQKEIMKALEIMERDSVAIAESIASLFSSLRLRLSEASSTSIENMECFSEVIGRLQESALDAASKGNKYIHSCLRLNEEMRGLDSLAMQLYPFLESLGWFISCMVCDYCLVDFPINWICEGKPGFSQF